MDKTENIVAEGRLLPLVVKKWLSRLAEKSIFPSYCFYIFSSVSQIKKIDSEGEADNCFRVGTYAGKYA